MDALELFLLQASASLARSTSSVATPTPTTSPAGVMMGLAGSLTPLRTGCALIGLTGTISCTNVASAQLKYGTGAAPANGAASTGTAIGSVASISSGGFPFACFAYVTGLTINTAIWIDAIVKSPNGISAAISALTIIAIEL